MKNRRNYETNQEPATLAEEHAPVRAAVKDSAESFTAARTGACSSASVAGS